MASRLAILAFLLIPVVPSSPPARAAEGLPVERAVEEARAKSPDYLRAVAASDEASAREFEAFSGYLPKLTATAQYLGNHFFEVIEFGPITLTPPSPITLAGASLRWNLFDGFQTTNGYRAARSISDAARREALRAALELENRVRLRFYQALSAQLLAEVADQNVKTLEDHLEKTKALLSGGATTRLDMLRVSVQLSEAHPDQIQAHDNVLIARKELASAMGLEDDGRTLEGVLPAPDAARIPTDLKLDVSARDDLFAMGERADAASMSTLASYSAWLPHVSASGEFLFVNNAITTSDPNNNLEGFTFGLALTWTLFDGANIAHVREAAAQEAQAERASEAVRQRAPVDFATWQQRFLYNCSLYQARKRAIDEATESVRLARASYEAGARTSTEVLDAELDLFRARAGAVRAQLDGAEALLNLELAVGRHL